MKGHTDQHKALEELGFVRGENLVLAWLKVVHVAVVYSRIMEGVLDVPVSFVVTGPPPLDDSATKEGNNW